MASINLVINFSTLSWLMMRKHWHETHCISSLKLFFRCQELKNTITWSRHNNFFSHFHNYWHFKFYWSNITYIILLVPNTTYYFNSYEKNYKNCCLSTFFFLINIHPIIHLDYNHYEADSCHCLWHVWSTG